MHGFTRRDSIRREQLGNLEAYRCPFTWLTLHLERIFLAKQDMQPLPDIADSNSGFEDLAPLGGRDAHPVINHLHGQPPVASPGFERDRSPLHFRANPVTNGVL